MRNLMVLMPLAAAAAAATTVRTTTGLRPACIDFTDLAAGLAKLAALHDFIDQVGDAQTGCPAGNEYLSAPPSTQPPRNVTILSGCVRNSTLSGCASNCTDAVNSVVYGFALLAKDRSDYPPSDYSDALPTRFIQAVRYASSSCSADSVVRIETFPIWEKCTRVYNSNRSVYVQSDYTTGSLTHRACNDPACSVGCVRQSVTSSGATATSACVAATDNIATSAGTNVTVKLLRVISYTEYGPHSTLEGNLIGGIIILYLVLAVLAILGVFGCCVFVVLWCCCGIRLRKVTHGYVISGPSAPGPGGQAIELAVMPGPTVAPAAASPATASPATASPATNTSA
ncbi:hypothetical protein HK105_205113 [Polyrhizophydium stewartii]|uniref:Uncharacterized protein n=1 Tax=Polyrhizophydium stewartii TaxID=2732419 RepID=A0ABR4N6T6_9FUNG